MSTGEVDVHESGDLGFSFGQWTQTELGTEDARAFLRHAYGQFYHDLDFSGVDLKDHTFVWQYAYRNALLTFRDVALSYAHHIKLLHATRIYPTLPETNPLEAQERTSATPSPTS